MALETVAFKMFDSILAGLATEQAKRIICMVLEELAKRTETKVDDEAVIMLKKLWGIS